MYNSEINVSPLPVLLLDLTFHRIDQAGITALITLNQITDPLVRSDDVIVLVQHLKFHRDSINY